MSKRLSKEEMRAYQKERRDRLKDVKPIVKPSAICVKPACKAPILDVKPCEECKALGLENRKLLAKIALLELQIKKGVKSEPLPTGDSAEDLYKRNLVAKNDRFSKLGMMAH